MELIVISDDALKIILDRSDMASFGTALEKNSLSKSALKRILRTAKAAGFADKYPLLTAEFYPSKDGGGELFVSRKNERKREIYIFDSFDDLLEASETLERTRLCSGGDLYSGDGKFFLAVEKTDARTNALLPEYSKKASDGCGLFLGERCRLLIKGNAVGTLGKQKKDLKKWKTSTPGKN